MNFSSRLPSVEKPWLKHYPEKVFTPSNCSAFAFLRDNRPYHQDDAALRYFSVSYTFGQMFELIEAYARSFTALGVKKGDIVALALPTTPENVFAFYGLNRIGAIANLVDLRSKGEVLQQYLKETNSDVVLACDLFADSFVQAQEALGFSQLIFLSPMESFPAALRFILGKKGSKVKGTMSYRQFLTAGTGVTLPEDEGKDGDAAVIMHTSGTSGTPKSVVMSNGAMNSMISNYSFICDNVRRGETFLNQVPPFLAYNIIMATHMPLCARTALRLLPEYRPDIFAANVAKYKPNYVIAGPADWGNFMEKPPKCSDFSFLRIAASGSDRLNSKTMAEVNSFLQQRGCTTEIIEGYGMTEIGAAAVSNMPGYSLQDSQGVPLQYNSLCIYDNENEKELSYGETGEICMTGPTLMTGYYNNPDATAETLRRHSDGIVWLHSGDLGKINEDGYLFLEGRLKRVIVRFDGIKVSPFTIEKLIMSNANVAGCCVVGHPDTEHGRGEFPAAYMQLKDGADSDAVKSEIRSLCTKGLAENYRPRKYEVLDALPITPNGKVDYVKLQNMS